MMIEFDESRGHLRGLEMPGARSSPPDRSREPAQEEVEGKEHEAGEDEISPAEDLSLFIRMYEPHEAREDTVLFPAFRRVVAPREYAALGEDFEKMEEEQFGEGGFEEMVDRVAGIERAIGIHDLSQFTPNV